MELFPNSHFRCPCADEVETSTSQEYPNEDSSAEEKPFNPYDARSNFSLFPLEYLLWCETCHDIKCPRCVIEEIVCWFCPSCGFEVAGSMVKSEGNRCTRNCYDCPSCTAPLFVTSLDTEGAAAPWILDCQHCNWTSLDIGMTFEKPNNIYGQVARLLGKTRSKVSRLLDDLSTESSSEGFKPSKQDPEARFTALMSFYKSELNKDSPSSNLYASPPGATGSDYSSPASFARIMNLYTGQGNYGKKASTKPTPMRAAADTSEGLTLVDASIEAKGIERLRSEGQYPTTTTEQRTRQPHNPRFQDEMLPQATLLATKRARRCRTCRHILVKPEQKINTTRYRIKLVAGSHIPAMTLKPLPTTAQQGFSWSSLPSSKPLQLLLTLTNPMFSTTKVTLATPTVTPGRFGHRVTLLCPQFTLGANADVWDDALTSNTENRRQSKLLLPPKPVVGEENKIAEAGKVWDRGRNWTSIVVEIVCARIDVKVEELGEDEDVVQIPVFVRLEYEQAVSEGIGRDVGAEAKEKGTGERVKRELTYWCVIGVGKVGIGV